MLRTESLCYSYADNAEAVSDFTAQFSERTVTYLCGPSGSGKTTLCLMLAELLDPKSGSISLSPDASPRATMTLQFAEELFLAETVDEEIAIGSDLSAQAKVRKLALSCGLDVNTLGGCHPLTLSFGQSRLLAIAIQCAKDTPVLILDEPTLGLDEINMSKVATLLRDLIEDGKTVVVVTHDSELIEALPGDVMLMNDGALRWKGRSEEFLAAEALLSLAAFA